MIRLENVTIGYGDRKLLKEAGAHFGKGRLIALCGRNGSGKSTLLRAMAGLNECYSGEILLCGRNSRKLDRRTMARSIAYVSTERTRIPNLSCRDVVAIGRAPYTNWISEMRTEDRMAVDRALRDTGMEKYAGRTMQTMSDGECQRIMIARALAQDTPVILLDEPTSFLDIPNRRQLAALLRELTETAGKTIVFSTHELDIAREYCHSIALIHESRLYHIATGDGHLEQMIEEVFNF